MSEAPQSLAGQAAAEWRAQNIKRVPARLSALALDPIEEGARRRCAVSSLRRMASLCESEASALERGDDGFAAACWEIVRLIAKDKAAATRPIFERASRPPETTETRAANSEKGRAAA